MKSPLFKDTLREISKTKSRFFSIFAIVFIGVAFFVGISGSGTIMKASADAYYDDYNLMDVRVVGTLGITKADVREMRKIEGVKGIYPAYTMDYIGEYDSNEYVMRVSSFNLSAIDIDSDNYMNRFVLVDGRLPLNANEVVIEASEVLGDTFKLGDTIKLKSGTSDDINDSLKNTEYTIVGLIHSPYYLTFEKGTSSIGSGSVNYYMYVAESNFDMDVYTDVFITFEGLDAYNSYTDKYFDKLEPYTRELRNLSYIRSEIRTNEVIDEAYEVLNEAKQEFEDGKKEFDEEIKKAEDEIKDAENEILMGRVQITTAEMILESTIQSSNAQIEMIESMIKPLEEQYATLKEDYESTNASIINAKKDLEEENTSLKAQQANIQSDYDNVISQIDTINSEISTLNAELVAKQLELASADDADKPAIQQEIDNINASIADKQSELTVLNSNSIKTEYENRQSTIDSNQTQIDAYTRILSVASSSMDAVDSQVKSLKKQIQDMKDTLEKTKKESEAEIATNKKKLDKADKDLAEGKITLEEERKKGQDELDDAEEKIAQAELDIEAIESARWYVLDRNSHYSYVDYEGAGDRMDAISGVFPVFFFLVAALVCLTTMTRLVDEQRSQIGTMKALGYTTMQISFKYVFYAAVATISGAILGVIFGILVFPWIIYTAWKMMYILPEITYAFQPLLMFGAIALAVLVTTLATFFACYSVLVETPSLLMRPKAPKIGKKIFLERIGFIWKRLSFTWKVTIRNMIRNKKRMFMTIVGISGCTALLIAGFGIKDSINDIITLQFKEIYVYNASIAIDKELSNEKKDELLEDVISVKDIDNGLLVGYYNITVVHENDSMDVTLVTAQNVAELNEYIDTHERISKKQLYLDNDTVIITEKMANDLGIRVDDKISIRTTDNIERSFVVGGIMENYTFNAVYMSNDYYRSEYGVNSVSNRILLKVDKDADFSSLALTLTDIDGVDSFSSFESIISTYTSMITSLNYIVIVLVISAGALAFVVLYNLTNVNISERVREIATLKVLGFRTEEVKKYVYNENIILTLLGALVGLFVGKMLHQFLMVVVELDNVMFGRNITLLSYAISFVITLIFGVLVNKVMEKKLAEIPMVESLKSVE